MRLTHGYRPVGFDDEDVYILELSPEELEHLEGLAGVSAIINQSVHQDFRDDLYRTLMKRHDQ